MTMQGEKSIKIEQQCRNGNGITFHSQTFYFEIDRKNKEFKLTEAWYNVRYKER